MPSRPPASSWAPNPRGAGFAGGVGQGGLEGSLLRRGRERSHSLTSHHHCPHYCFSLTCGILDPGTYPRPYRPGSGRARAGAPVLLSPRKFLMFHCPPTQTIPAQRLSRSPLATIVHVHVCCVLLWHFRHGLWSWANLGFEPLSCHLLM